MLTSGASPTTASSRPPSGCVMTTTTRQPARPWPHSKRQRWAWQRRGLSRQKTGRRPARIADPAQAPWRRPTHDEHGRRGVAHACAKARSYCNLSAEPPCPCVWEPHSSSKPALTLIFVCGRHVSL
eukprot:6961531-Prymnesium_polylepis.1